MFKQSKVVYIVSEENEGNPKLIIDDLEKNNIIEYFFSNSISYQNDPFIKFISSLPKNTIFCINVSYSQEKLSSSKIANIALPFISSHVNFPVKLGETIWFYPYDVSEQNIPQPNSFNVDGYYLGRVHSLLNTEDASYCFSEREQSVFNIDNDDIEDILESRQEGIIELLESNDLYLNENAEKNILHKFDEKVNTVISKKILNSDYYKKNLKHYCLRPSTSSPSNSEDFLIKGTYGNLIQLTSVGEDNVEAKGKFNFYTKKGKINLVVGENEKYKNSSLLDATMTKTKDTAGFVDEDGSILSAYNNNFLPEYHNGLFVETVKSSRSFYNKFKIDNKYLQSFRGTPTRSILNNISTLSVSEDHNDYKIVKNKIMFTIPHIKKSFDFYINNSNLKDNKVEFDTVIPFYSTTLLSDVMPNEEQSSIVGLSDNILFAVPDDGKGDIIFSTPNSPDSKSNYLRLTNDGNFHVNSHRIVLGDLNRIQSEAGISINNNHGEAAGLFLGFSEEMQSAVLGEQLKSFLEEIINVQKESITLTKDLFIKAKEIDRKTKSSIKGITNTLKELANTLNAAAGQPTPAGLAAVSSTLNLSISSKINNEVKEIDIDAFNTQIDNFKASGNANDDKKSSEELFNRLEVVESNLNKILSKFVKTS